MCVSLWDAMISTSSFTKSFSAKGPNSAYRPTSEGCTRERRIGAPR